jgi:hypothetical protein
LTESREYREKIGDIHVAIFVYVSTRIRAGAAEVREHVE